VGIFLARLDGSGRLNLCHSLIVRVAPFGRRHLFQLQSTRDDIFPGISDNIEIGFVGFDESALKIPDQYPDDVRVDQAADFALPFLKMVIYRRAFSSEIAACDARSSSTDIWAAVNTCDTRLFSR